MSFILFKLFKYVAITIAVLTYAQVGPGGVHIGEFVYMVRDELVKLEWTGLFEAGKSSGTNLINDVFDYFSKSAA